MEDRVETIKGLTEYYIAHLNIEHYRRLLETDIDEPKRQIVMRLLAEEQPNLVGILAKSIVREAPRPN